VEAGRRKGVDKYKRWKRNAKEKRIDFTRIKGIKDRNDGKKRKVMDKVLLEASL
jgi:hypothetical protein